MFESFGEGTVSGVATCQIVLVRGRRDGEVMPLRCDSDGEPVTDSLTLDDGGTYEWSGERDSENRRMYVHVGPVHGPVEER